jgi:hypothetical protein
MLGQAGAIGLLTAGRKPSPVRRRSVYVLVLAQILQ